MSAARDDVKPLTSEEECALLQPHFDAAYYLACYPDVAACGTDALQHFQALGWLEGRNPHPNFDMRYYCTAHPDIAAAGTNPFLHYILQGRAEGRRTRPELQRLRGVLAAASSPESRREAWGAATAPSAPIAGVLFAGTLAAAVLTESGRAKPLILSISHDDYTQYFGGVQNLIGDEQQAFAAADACYLHLSPAAPLPMLAEFSDDMGFKVWARLDGRAIGVALLSDIVHAVDAAVQAGGLVEMVVHHLMGWPPEAVAALAKVLPQPPLVWLHDYFALCASYALMRNDVVFCHAPPATSVACQICSYGQSRPWHVARIAAFFDTVRPWVLAPSDTALRVWQRHASLPHAGAAVVPLARLVLSGDIDTMPTPAARPLRVAHLGARAMHKGWIAFEELAVSLANDERYAFYHLGLDNFGPLPGCIRNLPVRVMADHREAMIEAIAENAIDVVVSWSVWPETFCFAVHEAIAGGAYVLARADAGNVWPAVQSNAPQRGCAVPDEVELHALFATGAIVQKVADAPPMRGSLLPGRGTADWLLHGRRGFAEPEPGPMSASASVPEPGAANA